MIGQTPARDRIAHYRIEEQLGSGGMGVVYRAHDTRLERTVALKLLNPSLTADPQARARLLREARTASALNHPHVSTIYDVGEADGETFIAMELVEGRLLSDLVGSDELTSEKVFRYGAQISDALAHAHERGIIHRDLKSSNIMITPDGRAKVLDFGLAKRFEDTSSEETISGESAAISDSIAGTLHYMAPEVLKGEAADSRSDLWSLGVLLYETATGQRPFHGKTIFELTSAILRDPLSVPANLPAGLRILIQRCLQKNPKERYQQAGDVRTAFEVILSETAILPAVRNLLVRRWALVVSYSLAAAVTVLLLLALRFSETVQGAIWNLPADRDIDMDPDMETPPQIGDASDQEESVTRRFMMGVEALGEAMGTVDSGSDEARQAYLRGRYYENRQTAGDLREAIRYYCQALEADPNFAPAYSGLADAYQTLGDWSFLSPDDSYPYALAAARKSLELDEGLSEAHASMGRIRFAFQGDRQGAEREFQMALRLNPDYAPAHQWYGEHLSALGRSREALREIEQALRLDPLSPPLQVSAGWVFLQARRYDRAEQQCRKTLEIDPTFFPAQVCLGWVHERRGRYRDAVQAFEKAAVLSGRNPRVLAGLGRAYALAGKRGKSREILREIRQHAAEQTQPPYPLAALYAGLGDTEETLRWLEKAHRDRSGLRVWLGTDPRLENLRPDPRFQDLLQKMNYPE